jgi:hypothetical protein
MARTNYPQLATIAALSSRSRALVSINRSVKRAAFLHVENVHDHIEYCHAIGRHNAFERLLSYDGTGKPQIVALEERI